MSKCNIIKQIIKISIPFCIALLIQKTISYFFPNIYAFGTIVCFFIFGSWYFLTNRSKNFKHKKSSLWIIILASIGFQFIISAILSITTENLPVIKTHYGENMVYGNVDIKFVALNLFIIAPITEELIFRGVIMNTLRSHFKNKTNVIIQALLFSVFHFNIIQGIYTFFVGIFFGKLKLKYNTLSTPIVAHISFNLASLLLPIVKIGSLNKLFFGIIILIFVCFLNKTVSIDN